MVLSQKALAHLAMLAFSALIAGSFSFGTRIANLADPVALMAIRFFIAGVVLGALSFFVIGAKNIRFEAIWRYLVLGGLMAIYFGLMFEGLKTAPAVSAAAVFTLTPIMAAGFGYIFLRQVSDARVLFALFIGGVGAIWVIFDGSVARILDFEVGRGELIYFVGCIAHAAYTPLIRKFNRGEPMLVFTFGMTAAGCFLLSLWGGKAFITTDWIAMPFYFWAAVLYLALFASASTFFLLQFASMRIPAAKVMAYSYATPVWVVAMELLVFSQSTSSSIVFGLAAIVLALLLLLRD